MISRVFYESIDVAILDSIVNLFFKQFYCETMQLQHLTQIPEKKLRQSLIKLDQAKIIKRINHLQLDYQRAFLKAEIEAKFPNDVQGNAEFYELNHDIKDVMRSRIKTIKKKISEDFLNFDQFTKVC